MNRLSRDQLCQAALDLADLSQLDQHDRPNGIIVDGAYSIGWLQRGLDYFHNHWPWASAIKSLTWTVVAGTNGYNVNASPINPSADFIVEVRDSLLISGGSGVINRRCLHGGYQDYIGWLARQVPGQTQRLAPTRYTLTPPTLLIWPTPDQAYTATLPYYSLPSVLTDGTTIPTFPDDEVLVGYLHVRAMEWSRQAKMGAAMEFAQAYIGKLQASGLGREAETNHIPFGQEAFRPMTSGDRTDWMGTTAVGP